MERIVRDITDRLTQKLPADRDFYSPEDLQVLDIPAFITDRVILEMNQNLNESLSPPDTEWASMKEEAVQFAWKNFIEAIKAEVRMPATYARSLFETAVADTLELAVQPRKAIPETLFGVDKMLSLDILKKRVTYITIGRKLAAALVRYMERKNRRTLKLEECRKIVTGVDERLVQDYNSLDWAKELDPLFLLAGPSVDTELLRIYFEDKEMPVLAARFDRLNKTVTRNEMIEVISKPVIEDPGSAPRTVSENDDAPAWKAPGTNGPSPSGETGLSDSAETDPGQEPSHVPQDSILASFQRKRGDAPDEELQPDAEASQSETDQIKKSSIPADTDERHETTDEPVSGEDHGSIYKEMNLKKEPPFSGSPEEDDSIPGIRGMDRSLLDKWETIGGGKPDREVQDEQEPVIHETERPDDEDEVVAIEFDSEAPGDDDKNDVPMWRAFLEREDFSKLRDSEADEAEPETKRQALSDDDSSLMARFSRPEPSEEEQLTELKKWMSDEKERFVGELFKKSEKRYEKVLRSISEHEDWNHASSYIRKNVFKKNKVDVFDETAVDFTDRLHTFFLDRKSQ